MIPGVASWIMHQSWPPVLFLRDSHPSIHFPRSVYLPGIKMPLSGFNKFSFLAKKSSLHKTVSAPNLSAARLINEVNGGSVICNQYNTNLGELPKLPVQFFTVR